MNYRETSLFGIVRKNGRLIKKEHNLLFTSKGAKTDYKQDDTPVTRVDHAVNDSLMAWAHEHGLGYVGEEGNGALDSEHVLYVDPIDGTVAFTLAMNTATIIATIMLMNDDEGIPVTSIIHQPLGDHTWVSSIDSKTHYYGPSCPKGRVIRTSENRPDKIRTSICAFPGANYDLQMFKRNIGYYPLLRDQSMGAFGYGGGLIASDLLDATLIGGNAAIESAAMSLIITNAGGIACDLLGDPLNWFKLGEVNGKPDFELPNGALFASNQYVADMVLEAIRTCQ